MSLLSVPAPTRRPVPRRDVDATPRRDTRPPLRLVEPSAPRRRPRIGLVGTTLFVAVALGVFALAAVHSLVVQAQFEIDRIDQQVAERNGELESLRLEVARLESPAAITQAARDLGLVTPSERVYLEPVVSPRMDERAGPAAGSAPSADHAAGSAAGGR